MGFSLFVAFLMLLSGSELYAQEVQVEEVGIPSLLAQLHQVTPPNCHYEMVCSAMPPSLTFQNPVEDFCYNLFAHSYPATVPPPPQEPQATLATPQVVEVTIQANETADAQANEVVAQEDEAVSEEEYVDDEEMEVNPEEIEEEQIQPGEVDVVNDVAEAQGNEVVAQQDKTVSDEDYFDDDEEMEVNPEQITEEQIQPGEVNVVNDVTEAVDEVELHPEEADEIEVQPGGEEDGVIYVN